MNNYVYILLFFVFMVVYIYFRKKNIAQSKSASIYRFIVLVIANGIIGYQTYINFSIVRLVFSILFVFLTIYISKYYIFVRDESENKNSNH
ncbi:MAG: hypothetical protein HYZ42_03060 [Bacteroidetes bacterium]|nr:hypothetical protein [Bacteroidota bacterium]